MIIQFQDVYEKVEEYKMLPIKIGIKIQICR